MLFAGAFLLIFSDTEIWPFGYQSFYYAVTHNPEVAQHKTFAAILLALGVVAMLRTSGRLRAAWSAWIFPVLALGVRRCCYFIITGACTDRMRCRRWRACNNNICGLPELAREWR